MIEIDALAAEITNDPLAIGYKEAGDVWKDDQVIADLMNDLANGDLIWRLSIPMADVYGVVDWEEFFGLPANIRQAFQLISSTVFLNTDSVEIQDAFSAIFPGGGPTRPALIALAHVQGSRAEVLFGEGSAATAGLVGAAANV